MQRRRGTRSRGFTLLELLIVVALIAVIAAITIPSLTSARATANAARAIATLRTISTCQEQYRTRFGRYADDPSVLEAAGYLQIAFDAYTMFEADGTPRTWYISVGPTTPEDGDIYFFTDHTGVIRFSTTGVATAANPPWQ